MYCLKDKIDKMSRFVYLEIQINLQNLILETHWGFQKLGMSAGGGNGTKEDHF